MNKKQFGQLIAALRKELLDENGKQWTQIKLAETTDLSEELIKNLENGRKVNLETDILTKLADVLKLTSGEREQLFLAASGVGEKDIAQKQHDPEIILGDLINLMEKVQSPAFILDPFADIVASNLVLALFHDFDPNIFQNESTNNPAQYNIMRLAFAPEFDRQRKGIADWDDLSQRMMAMFRVVSFRHRAHPYYQVLLKGLLAYPWFKKVWREERQPEYRFTDNLWFRMNHPKFGIINCMSNTVTAITSIGDLKLYTFTPLDDQTLEIFAKMTKLVGTKAYRLPTWPEKRISTQNQD